MKLSIFSAFFLFLTLFSVTACKEDEPPLPDNLLQFEVAEQGFSDTENEIIVKLSLSRALESASTATIDISSSTLTYGEKYTTLPAAESNRITLSLPAGSTEAALIIRKTSNVFLTGTESIKFTLKSVGAPLLAGNIQASTIKFASIVSEGSELTLNGIVGTESGASAKNSVYVDFSNNQATPVLRSSWDFAFFSGNDFRVLLNNTTSATAKVLDKSDLNAVTAADTLVKEDWIVGNFEPKEMALVDDVAGDLSKTVIAEVSSADANNRVYIVNRGTGGGIESRSWLKIRVLRKNSNEYTLQYAKITDTNFKTIDIAKDPKLNFVYLAVDGNTATKVRVEPEKASWDIRWGYQMSQTQLSPGVMIPYASSDFVAINHRAGVEVAEVLTTAVPYETFDESNLASVAFKSVYDVIGTNWRTASATPGSSGVKKDRFYILKDAASNVYKIKFLSFHPDEGGVRGKPKLEYKLVKKGS
jgi:hypothetical protein